MEIPAPARERLVKLPGVTDAEREKLDTERDALRRNRVGLLSAIYQRNASPYEGAVPAKVKAARRARGKVAKASRRVNRGRS